MPDVDISGVDYGKFSEAATRVTTLTEALSEQKDIIMLCKTNLDNDAVFAGPLCEKAMEKFQEVCSAVESTCDNFSVIKGYIEQSISNYSEADEKAVEYLDIKDGVVTKVNSSNSDSGSDNDNSLVDYLNAQIGKDINDYSNFTPNNWCGDFVSKMLKDNGYNYEWSSLAGNENEGILLNMKKGGAEIHYGGLAKQRGVTDKVDYTPQPGDVFTIDVDGDKSIDHTGFIIKDNGDGTVTTLEGNTYKNGHEYDGGVVEKHTTRKKSDIYAYATPKRN
ncbi:MAG: CHAP domain-containing protein [Bacilli bacterium]|nr:CHAP domain-containing protein [Bacilli bacterium]